MEGQFDLRAMGIARRWCHTGEFNCVCGYVHIYIYIYRYTQ